MSRKMLLLVLAALCAAAVLHAEEIDLDYFYQTPADHGEWFEIAPYGWVWTPDGVEAGWKPYADGRWVYTDFGRTFESEKPESLNGDARRRRGSPWPDFSRRSLRAKTDHITLTIRKTDGHWWSLVFVQAFPPVIFV